MDSEDFSLQIADHPADLAQGEAAAQQFIPQALAIKTQAELLARELAVEFMGLANEQRIDFRAGRVHALKRCCCPVT